MYRILILFTILIIYSCDNSNVNIPTDTLGDYNKAECLANIYDNIAIPAFEDLQSKIDLLQASSQAFVESPMDSVELLNEFRSDWFDAYCSWQYVEVFSLFGLGEDIDYGFKMNTYPTDINRTNNIVNGIAQFNPAYIDNQGFPALEYLIYGISNSDEEILISLNNSNARTFITSLVSEMKNNSSNVLSWWNNNRSLIVNDNTSTATSSLNLLINDFIYYYEKGFRTNKFGIPSGYFSSGLRFPNKTEGYYAKNISKSLALHSQNSISNLFEGVSHNDNSQIGESFYSYLSFLEESLLAEDIAVKLDEVELAIINLDNDFATQVENNNDEMLITFSLIQSVVAKLKIEMMSAMGVGIDYVSGDGD